jgi:O-antigen/teichoic acid export membrane protein
MDARLRRDVAWNLVPVALLGVVGLGMNFAIATWWGAAALAIFNLVTITYFVLAVVGACGLQYAVLRAVAERPEDRDHVAAAVVGALVPSFGLAAAATALFLVLRGPLAHLHGSPEVARGIAWAAPGLFAFSINKVLFCVVNGLRRMRAFAIYTSLRYLAIAAGLVLARELGWPPAVVWSVTELAMLVVLGIELACTVSLGRARDWRPWVRRHLSYGSRGVVATLGYELHTKLDVWMLGAAGIAKATVGVYALGAALAEGATQLSVAVANNLNPIIAGELAAGRPREVEALAKRTRKWFVPAFAGACALGAAIYPLAIPRLVGAEFAAGTVAFAILMLGLALASPYLPFSQVLLMADRPGWHTVLIVTVVALNLAAQLLLIPLWGIRGAASAMAFAQVSSALLVRWLAKVRVGVQL